MVVTCVVLTILGGFLQKAEHPEHAFYISVIEIREGRTTDLVDIRLKVFSDDLYTALYNQDVKHLTYDHSALYAKHPQEIERYFRDHLHISINEQQGAFTVDGCTVEADALWFSLTMKQPDIWRTISIHADYFMEVYPTQSQMVHIKYRGQSRMLRLTRKKPKGTIQW